MTANSSRTQLRIDHLSRPRILQVTIYEFNNERQTNKYPVRGSKEEPASFSDAWTNKDLTDLPCACAWCVHLDAPRSKKTIRVKAEGLTQLPVWTFQSKSPTGHLITILNLNVSNLKKGQFRVFNADSESNIYIFLDTAKDTVSTNKNIKKNKRRTLRKTTGSEVKTRRGRCKKQQKDDSKSKDWGEERQRIKEWER